VRDGAHCVSAEVRSQSKLQEKSRMIRLQCYSLASKYDESFDDDGTPFVSCHHRIRPAICVKSRRRIGNRDSVTSSPVPRGTQRESNCLVPGRKPARVEGIGEVTQGREDS
jgi:hypothetical protein